MKQTVLHATHVEMNAKMADHQGFQVPFLFSDISEEWQAVRRAAGLFDVSCLGRIEVRGQGATGLLQTAFTRSMAKVPVGSGQYGLFCTSSGGMLDDSILFHLAPNRYLVTTNPQNIDKIMAMLAAAGGPDVQVQDLSATIAQFALQGPKSLAVLEALAAGPVKRFAPHAIREMTITDVPVMVSRTGYTGEHGYELFVPADNASAFWRSLLAVGREAGLLPCGFAVRDVLRLEAGNLQYGMEIDETRNPFEAGLAGLLDMKKEFTGKEALQRIKTEGPKQKLAGFVLLDKGVPKNGGSIFSESRDIGVVTSGCQSPHKRAGIGLGYVVSRYAQPGQEIEIEVRDKEIAARTVELPFYKRK